MRLVFPLVAMLLGGFLFIGCEGNEELVEKARIEGKESAKGELQAQLEEKEQLVEKARNEGKASAEAGIKVNNENLALKAQEMEADLAVRNKFYQAVEGTYEGVLTTDQGDRKVKLNLVPSLPAYPTTRKRQIEEITSDLNNLYFNVQVVQWDSDEPVSAVGCRAEHIRPDLLKGEISIASPSCPNVYTLRILDDNPISHSSRTPGSGNSNAHMSMALAAAIKDGKISEISRIEGEMHPATNGKTYSLSVARVPR